MQKTEKKSLAISICIIVATIVFFAVSYRETVGRFIVFNLFLPAGASDGDGPSPGLLLFINFIGGALVIMAVISVALFVRDFVGRERNHKVQEQIEKFSKIQTLIDDFVIIARTNMLSPNVKHGMFLEIERIAENRKNEYFDTNTYEVLRLKLEHYKMIFIDEICGSTHTADFQKEGENNARRA